MQAPRLYETPNRGAAAHQQRTPAVSLARSVTRSRAGRFDKGAGPAAAAAAVAAQAAGGLRTLVPAWARAAVEVLATCDSAICLSLGAFCCMLIGVLLCMCGRPDTVIRLRTKERVGSDAVPAVAAPPGLPHCRAGGLIQLQPSTHV
jgi:hypothetical protein